MSVLFGIGLLILAIVLFLANKRGSLDNDTRTVLVDIATIIAAVGGIMLSIFPSLINPPPPLTPTPPIEKTIPSSDITPDTTRQELRILQPDLSDFAAGYHEWFEDYAENTWKSKRYPNTQVIVTNTLTLHRIQEYVQDKEFEIKDEYDLIGVVLPPHDLESKLVGLDNINQIAQEKFDSQASICRESTFSSGKFIGFCIGWTPELSHIRQGLWENAGFEHGPDTYDDLLKGGQDMIDTSGQYSKNKVGIWIANTENQMAIDSNNAVRAFLWSHGAYVQDTDGRVVIDSPAMRNGLSKLAVLYNEAITDTEVLNNWSDEFNNVCLIQDCDCSYILNASLEASTLKKCPELDYKDDILATRPLIGIDESENQRRFAPPHIVHIYIVPKSIAKEKMPIIEEFLFDLAGQNIRGLQEFAWS